jgi:MYXO-CTERM domain-containing protein
MGPWHLTRALPFLLLACEADLQQPLADNDADLYFDGATGDPDGDTLTTGLEIALGLAPDSPDTDDDGVLDCIEARPIGMVGALCPNPSGAFPDPIDLETWNTLQYALPDTDGDQIPDVFDDDDDDDGILTSDEVFQLIEPDNTLGEDVECVPVIVRPRPRIVFAEFGGVWQHLYSCPGTLTPVIALPVNDSDGDGTPNWRDPDDDDDGIPTFDENADGDTDWFDDDSDGDGVVDFLDAEEDPGAAIDTGLLHTDVLPSIPPGPMDDGVAAENCGCSQTPGRAGFVALLGLVGLLSVRRR